MKSKELVAYKLFRVRKNGTLGSLFIARRDVLPVNKWLKAKPVRTEGFAFRPGWHACSEPNAPHLSTEGRQWFRVRLKGITEHQRPAAQGGLWFTAKNLKIEHQVQI